MSFQSFCRYVFCACLVTLGVASLAYAQGLLRNSGSGSQELRPPRSVTPDVKPTLPKDPRQIPDYAEPLTFGEEKQAQERQRRLTTPKLPVVVSTFELVDINGEVVRGELKSIDAGKVTFRTASKMRVFAIEQVRSIRRQTDESQKTERPASEKQWAVVTLLDGTTFQTPEFCAHNGKVDVVFPGLLPQNKPKVSVVSLDILADVRFHVDKISEMAAPPRDWQRLAQNKNSSDLLVVKANDQLSESPFALKEITGDSVIFEHDGKITTLKKEKVYGVIFKSEKRSVPEIPKTTAHMLNVSGNLFCLTNVRFDGDSFELTTPLKIILSVDIASLKSLEFSPILPPRHE